MSGSRQHETDTQADTSTEEEGGVTLVDDGPLKAAEDKIAELEARLRTVSAAYKEKVDEIDRVKDRLTRQATVQDEIRRGEVVASLFEPVENLHRSVGPLRAVSADSARGLEMVHQQFMQALARLGLEEVPGEGTRFDPSVHEALASQPVQDPAQDGMVLSVYSTGYRIGTRTIRPARVVIGSYMEPTPEA